MSVSTVNDGRVLMWTLEALDASGDTWRQGEMPFSEVERRGYDKRAWPRGPWDDEPDFVMFKHQGMRCLVVRSGDSGSLGGYVEVDKPHPLYGFEAKEARVKRLHAPNGVTFSMENFDTTSWVFGFTCSQTEHDYCPALVAYKLEQFTEIIRRLDAGWPVPDLIRAKADHVRRRLPELRQEVREIYDASRDTMPGRARYRRYRFVREHTEGLAAQLAALALVKP